MIGQNTFSPKEIQTYQQLAQERLVVYRFLSTVYCYSPDLQLAKKLLSAEMLCFLEQQAESKLMNNNVTQGLNLIKEFIREYSNQGLEKLQTSLAVDYTKLLRGLRPGYGPKPPYESVYRSKDKQPSQEILRQIRCFYAELGVSLELKDQPDFIGLELGLMCYLIEQEIDAWQNEQEEQAIASLNKQWELFNHHIFCWVPDFCRAMFDQATQKFYQGIALITLGYIRDDCEQLKNALVSTKLEVY